MSCKKIVGWALIHGVVISAYMIGKNNGFNISCLKRKGKQLTRKAEKFITNIDEDGLTKYKQNLIKEYNKIKEKIDSITIKDIKDAGNEIIENILDSIENLKTKVLTSS